MYIVYYMCICCWVSCSCYIVVKGVKERERVVRERKRKTERKRGREREREEGKDREGEKAKEEREKGDREIGLKRQKERA